jgi:hypothetical protein
MQPAVSSVGAAVSAAAGAVAALPAHLDPSVLARGEHAAATPATLPLFDPRRFVTIDQRAPLPQVEVASVEASHAAAGQTYGQAHAQIAQLAAIPAPEIQLPASPAAFAPTSREAAIARIEGEVHAQATAQAPAQFRQAAATVQGALTNHITTQQSDSEAQTQQLVATGLSQAQEIASAPPPITGAQAAAQAQPEYQSHQAQATAAQRRMQTQIAASQANAEGNVQGARGRRDAQLATARGQYEGGCGPARPRVRGGPEPSPRPVRRP